MSQYYNLKVKEIVKETDDAVTILFEQPKELIQFKPGQFLTLIIPVNGVKERRSYSLCSLPGADHLAVTVKKVMGGKVSNFLVNSLTKGAEVEVMQPLGTFTVACDYHKKRDIVLIGAGSGMTPLMSIALSVLANEPLSNIFLVYGNRNENSIIFKEALNKLKTEHGDRLSLIHILSQPVSKSDAPSGRINRSSVIKMLETFPRLKMEDAEYFICGPHGMMDEAVKALDILKVPTSKIHKESFESTSTGETKVNAVAPQDGKIINQEVTVIYQGSEYKFMVPAGKMILESALQENIDLPFSCQSGVCTACMGKCTSGKVKLNDPDGLSDKEIQQGFVLTCVGQPATADVVIEID